MSTTLTTDDDFEPQERGSVSNDGTLDDEWTFTENSIKDPNDVVASFPNATMQQQYPSASIANRDEDDVGVPSNIVVELPSSMSSNTTNQVRGSSKAVEFIRNGGDVDDTESLGVASRTTVTSSVLHQFERLNTDDGSITDTPTAVNQNGNNEELDKEKQPTVCDVRNSDRHSCWNSASSSNKWSTLEEQQRYRESGRNPYGNSDCSVSTWDTSVGGGGYSAHNMNRAVVTQAMMNDDDDQTTGAMSTISGFDIISLNGTSSQRACHNCTLLNPYESLFCEVCNAALQPNPCPDADAILAQQLQDEENKYAFSIVQSKETKRKSIFTEQPLLIQAQEFKKDIYDFMNEFKNRDSVTSFLENDKIGYYVVPEVSTVILASQFIETMTSNHRMGKNADVLIRYCVTPKLDGLYYDKINENAFPSNSKFSLHFALALENRCEPLDAMSLGVIPEDTAVDSAVPKSVRTSSYASSRKLSDNLGWIAAIVKGDETTDNWNHLDQCYTIDEIRI
jgi:hypothetical protein